MRATNGSGLKEVAHFVHDSLREASRGLPLSGTKPKNTGEKAGAGLILQEEVFNILDKIYKNMKPE